MEYIILALAMIMVVFAIGIYNRLVTLRQNVNQSVADIDMQLRQRHDLVPNFVNVVKFYAGDEREMFQEVIAARNQAAQGAVSSADEVRLRVALDRFLALAKANTELCASPDFQQVQRELGEVEDKLAAARRALNAAVSRYNTGVESFPAVLFAGILGFGHADFHRLDDSEKGSVDKVPQVKF